jgi:hypothetical protein
VTITDEGARQALLRRGFALEWVTLGWNVAGIIVLAIAVAAARSVALAGFGLDSLIEIGASTVVIWELSGSGEERQRRSLRVIGCAFAALAIYLLVQSTVVLAIGYRPQHSVLGIAWTAVTAAAMFTLAAGKARTGRALNNPVLRTEGRVTMIDGVLAVAVLLGLTLNAGLGWWWADPAAGYVLVYYAIREVREIFRLDSVPGGMSDSDAGTGGSELAQARADLAAAVAPARVPAGFEAGESGSQVTEQEMRRTGRPAARLALVPLAPPGHKGTGIAPEGPWRQPDRTGAARLPGFRQC